jgi:hypothetical protein
MITELGLTCWTRGAYRRGPLDFIKEAADGVVCVTRRQRVLQDLQTLHEELPRHAGVSHGYKRREERENAITQSKFTYFNFSKQGNTFFMNSKEEPSHSE